MLDDCPLAPGTRLHLGAGAPPCVVEGGLGQGGQGWVVAVDHGGAPCAVKWYRPEHARADGLIAERLRRTIREGAPDARFCWPLALVSAPGLPGLGYLMRRLPPHLRGLRELRRGSGDPAYAPQTSRGLATAGYHMADAYKALHLKGLCYIDLNGDNVFLDGTTGETMICDNDNADYAGRVASTLGRRGYRAPEVERLEARPSPRTDLHGLAVLLFEMLMRSHPLVGAAKLGFEVQDEGERHLFAERPTFVFDPRDPSNRALSRRDSPHAALAGAPAVPRWAALPAFLRDLFTTTFTEGLRPPYVRATDDAWRVAFLRLRDSVFRCAAPGCGRENFYDVERLTADATERCAYCGEPLALPPRVRLGGETVVVLDDGAELYAHHLDPTVRVDLSRPLGRVARDGEGWDLLNLTAQTWSFDAPNGTAGAAPPGGAVRLASRTRVDFGGTVGEVRH